MYLALDTSTDTAGLALVGDNEVFAESTWRCGQNHTTQLLPRLMQLLDQAELSLQSARGIIVARGPGSFNGLRVGISTAKGLAFSLGIPLVAISTLAAEAYQHAATDLPVCPLFDAGREEIATAIYRQKEGEWRQLITEQLTTVAALCSRITEKTVFCGELTPLIATQLSKELRQKAVLAATARRAIFLAELGRKRLQAGDYDNPATLQPLYLRRPQITKPKHKEWSQK